MTLKTKAFICLVCFKNAAPRFEIVSLLTLALVLARLLSLLEWEFGFFFNDLLEGNSYFGRLFGLCLENIYSSWGYTHLVLDIPHRFLVVESRDFPEDERKRNTGAAYIYLANRRD